jgi:hypothetical protein
MKRTITISFDSDAPDDVIQEVAEVMQTQLEFLSDGDMVRSEDGTIVVNPFGMDANYESIRHTCENVTMEIK